MRPSFIIALLLPVLAHADEAAPLDPAAAPPGYVDTQTLLTTPGAVKHLRIYAVDETCFTEKALKGKTWPTGLGVVDLKIGGVSLTSLTLSGPSPAPFEAFKGFVDKLVPKGRKAVYGLNLLGSKAYGYRAVCVQASPVLDEPTVQYGRIVNKKQVEQAYRLGFLVPGLEKLRTQPKTAHRVAIVYDEVLVIALTSLDELRERTETSVLEAFSLLPPETE